MDREITISSRSLSIGYRLVRGCVNVVHPRLDLDLRCGEVTCLLGLNGAGKSTLIKTLCGFIPPLGGEIFVFGRPLSSFNQTEFSRTVGVVLTEKTPAGGITVRELVSLGRYPHTGFFGRLSDEDRRIADAAMESVGISAKAESFVADLSDGERQKTFIAKAIAQECPIIILDEPTAFLDVASRVEMMILLRSIAQEQGRSILLSTHDLDGALQFADCIWLQEKSGPMVCGAPETLVADGSLERFFSRDGLRFDPIRRRIINNLNQ